MRCYALDIETDTSTPTPDPEYPPGLDPRHCPVISAAVWDTGTGTSAYFTGAESEILTGLEAHFASLPAGLIVTWNGANFDLPYLDTRYGIAGLGTTLSLEPADNRPPKYNSGPGRNATGYWAMWGAHRHVDIAFAYQEAAEALGVTWSLKPVAKAFGIEMISVDASAASELSGAELEEYNVSDVRGTAELAKRLSVYQLDQWCDPAN